MERKFFSDSAFACRLSAAAAAASAAGKFHFFFIFYVNVL